MLRKRGTLVFGSGDLPAAVIAALTWAGATATAADEGRRRLPADVKAAAAIILTTAAPEPLAAWLDLLERHPARGRQPRIALGWEPEAPPVIAQSSTPIRYLSLPRAAARILLNRWPLHFSADVAGGQAPHLLMLGCDRLLRAVLVQAMRLGHYGQGPLVIDLLCATPRAAEQWFEQAYPQARAFCRVAFHPLAGHSALAAGSPTAAYIGMDDDARGLAAATRLSAQLDRQGLVATPIYLLLNQPPGEGGVSRWDGRLYPFAALDQVCRPEVLFGTVRDVLARIIHDHYQDTVASQARDAATAPAGTAWKSLDESYRDASRQQGDHVTAKLALARCSASFDLDGDLNRTPYTFPRDQIERLARVEHQRWAADRHLGGWTYGEPRDNRRKKHPDLVPYGQLSEPTKDLDRFAVRLLPALLGRQNLSVKPQLRVLLWLSGGDPRRRAVERLSDQLFARLGERFGGHQPVLLTRLTGAGECDFAAHANGHHDIPLQVLFPRADDPGPSPSPVPSPESPDHDYLRLLASAQARLPMVGATPAVAWLRQGADIICADSDGLSLLVGKQRDPRYRIAELDTRAGHIRWHFDY